MKAQIKAEGIKANEFSTHTNGLVGRIIENVEVTTYTIDIIDSMKFGDYQK